MRLSIMITYVLLKIVLCNTFGLERLTICLPIRVLVSIRLLQKQPLAVEDRYLQ